MANVTRAAKLDPSSEPSAKAKRKECTMSEQREVARQSGTSLVFACSGAADVGAISDRAARRLSAEKSASMCCIAAIGADIQEIVAKARSAGAIVAIDGCSLECAKKVLEQGGFQGFAHVQLEDMGMGKGKSPVTDERVETVAQEARKFCCR